MKAAAYIEMNYWKILKITQMLLSLLFISMFIIVPVWTKKKHHIVTFKFSFDETFNISLQISPFMQYLKVTHNVTAT